MLLWFEVVFVVGVVVDVEVVVVIVVDDEVVVIVDAEVVNYRC